MNRTYRFTIIALALAASFPALATGYHHDGDKPQQTTAAATSVSGATAIGVGSATANGGNAKAIAKGGKGGKGGQGGNGGQGGQGGQGGGGGNATGGNAAGGSVGSLAATNGDQTQSLVFQPVVSWNQSAIPTKTTATIKNTPEVAPPSMPATANCIVGASGGAGWAGFGFSLGVSYDHLLCFWERQHAIQVAVHDEEGAKDTRAGMTMMICEKTPPAQRKYFKQCEDFDRNQQPASEQPNAAFSSAG